MKRPIIVNEIIALIFFVIAAIIGIITIILLIIKLTGRSPDAIIILAGTVATISALQIAIISVLFQIKESLGRLEEFRHNIKEFQKQTIAEIKNLKRR